MTAADSLNALDALSDLPSLTPQARADFAACTSAAALEDAKARYLGKASAITQHLKNLGKLQPDQRREAGARINAVKQAIEEALASRRQEFAQAMLEQQLREQALDVTLPGVSRAPGGLHPVMMAQERIETIFAGMGFAVADGPEIETQWFNFTALNQPEDHPARSMHDTFYLQKNDASGTPLLLRTHTSPVQIRYAQEHVARHADVLRSTGTMPDIRIIAPGRVYRVDSDATHSPMFHQFEGLWIAEAVSFADLQSVYLAFLRAFFEQEDLRLRFRPSYFPFTEPSAEIDVQFASGPLAGRWLEICGAGQVHPQVVRNMGLEPERFMGFAFGSGIDRLAMLRYGVGDLREFFENDLRFLEPFRA